MSKFNYFFIKGNYKLDMNKTIPQESENLWIQVSR